MVKPLYLNLPGFIDILQDILDDHPGDCWAIYWRDDQGRKQPIDVITMNEDGQIQFMSYSTYEAPRPEEDEDEYRL
jgi:hypothetical protein